MASKNIPDKTWLLAVNFDGTLDSRYPAGDKPSTEVVAPAIALGTITSSSVEILITGGLNIDTLVPQRRLAGGGAFTSLPVISSTASSYVFTGLSADTGYDFRLSASNVHGSADSNTLTADTTLPEWQLPPGHFVEAKGPLSLIYPRPNIETLANARHKKAYYDGVNPIQYRIPIGVRLGAPPYYFELVQGPSGMAVGGIYGEPNYGVVTWTPTASVSNATVIVQVQDQDEGSINVEWTVSTSSSTSDFIFVAPAGSDANSGAIGSPKQTLAGAFGATFATAANGGAVCYVRAGTYTLPAYTDNNIAPDYTCLEFDTVNKPAALIGYPGETVTLDTANGRMATMLAGSDMFLQDLHCSGYMNSAQNFKLLFLGTPSGGSRITCDGIQWTGAGYGSVGDDNATMFYGGGLDGEYRLYLYLKNCSESGRSVFSPNNNSYSFCCLFSVKNLLIEQCSAVANATSSFYLKGTNEDCTVRYCTIQMTNSGDCIASEGFNPDGLSARIEWCYNKIRSGSGASRHALQSATGSIWVYRNTFYDTNVIVNTPNSNGPYVFDDNVITTDNTPLISTGTEVTNNGDDCQGPLSAGIVDATTLELIGTYRTNHLGTRGWEIA